MASNNADINTRIEDYTQYFNRSALRRTPSILRNLFGNKYGRPMIYLAGGLPNEDLFPIKGLELTLKNSKSISLDDTEVKTALQYGVSKGLSALIAWMIDHVRRLHDPPTLSAPNVMPTTNSAMDIQVCNGCQDGMHMILDLMVEEGDSVLVEEATFPTMMTMMQPLGVRGVAVNTDANGIIPSHLDHIMSTWDTSSGPIPRLLYCIPTAQNPTGVSWSLDRKKAVYQLARKYQLLILEDDPYYMLQFNRPLTPSLLSMDVDGRVLRCDSMSKTLAPGTRVGFISGPRQFIAMTTRCMEVTSGSPNVLSQMIILKILQEMGHDGFMEHTYNIMKFYQSRSIRVAAMASKHLKGLADVTSPAGGMFLWIKLLGVKDSSDVCQKLAEKGITVVHGSVFHPTGSDSPYIRVSFSYVSEDKLDKSFQTLAEVMQDVMVNK